MVKPINTGGENVFPDEVEAVLKYHAKVADAAVVGVKDRLLGERLVALVQPAGTLPPDLKELTEWSKARLVGYRVPRAIIIVDAIRRLESGRPDYEWARGVAADGGAAAAGGR